MTPPKRSNSLSHAFVKKSGRPLYVRFSANEIRFDNTGSEKGDQGTNMPIKYRYIGFINIC